MKKFSVLLITLIYTLPAFSQKWESVKNNPDYLSGEGWGSSVAEADKHALADLISKIAINVSSSSTNVDNSTITNGDLNEVSQFSASVNTYAQATLTNTERIILKNEPDAHVGRWIKKTEIEKIFISRINKAKEYVSQALNAEKKGKADDALRYYYWSLTLLKSLQRPNDVNYVDKEGNNHMLMAWIPQQMDNVFDDLKVQVDKHSGDCVELFVTYKNKPVNSIDYTYFDGKDWSNIYSAKDGRGVLELMPGIKNEIYQLKYEFEYRGQSQIDPELESVMNVVKSTPMRNAYVTVSAKQTSTNQGVRQVVHKTFSTTDASINRAPETIEQAEEYIKLINQVTKAIQNKTYSVVKPMFTTEGWDIYTRLIQYGKARLVGAPSFQFFQSGDCVIARGVQMAFSFARGVRKSFVEDVVFTFDSSKKISNIAFGLGNTAADDILNKGVWSQKARLALMSFLENYKTAYGLERLDYIRSLFDDNAVIIVGSVLRTVTSKSLKDAGAALQNNTIIKKNRYTKDQYIANLDRCFRSNEYINIRFANNDVYKMAQGGELYAIQIAQDYYSTNYGDKGYLFLMVDINDPDNPIIKVRTWQPEKDPDFGLYGPGDF